MTSEPLRVTATLFGRLILPVEGYISLDALLAWAVCAVEMRPPALDADQLTPVEIPVVRSECGRYHLSSVSQTKVVGRDRRWLNKRFPIEWWQMLGAGPSVNRIQINAGPSKGFRVPVEAHHLAGQRLTWWCVGNATEIRHLLNVVTHVGRRRAVGEGEVRSWTVEPCEPWGEGFPVWRDGQPLRALPLDDERVEAQHVMRYARVTYPYWLRADEDLVTVPQVSAA